MSNQSADDSGPGGAAMRIEAGATLGNYHIDAFLVSGGMASVYRATDIRLNRRVAFKVLARDIADNDEFQERFLRESRFAASLDHPNIIPIFDAGNVDGVLYIAMRYVDGTDLARHLSSAGALDPTLILAVLKPVANALDTAHAAGLVHRDVKPGNILLAHPTGREPLPHPYLVDFGITKRTSATTDLTGTGQFVGTLAYISPEQISGGQVGPKSDQYALGCVAYETLTGVPPFVRNNQAALLWAHLNATATPISSYRMDAGAADSVIARALAKDPESRFGSCGEFADALTETFSSARSDLRHRFIRPGEESRLPAGPPPVPRPTTPRAATAVGPFVTSPGPTAAHPSCPSPPATISGDLPAGALGSRRRPVTDRRRRSPSTSNADPTGEPDEAPPSGRRSRRRSRARWVAATAVAVVAGAGGIFIWSALGPDAEACEVINDTWPQLQGTTVSLSSDVDDPQLQASLRPFYDCTGVGVVTEPIEGPLEFMAQAATTPPDMVIIHQPGVITELARRSGVIQPASPTTVSNARRSYDDVWLDVGSIDGTLYATPVDFFVKSLVWYSPTAFRDRGLTVPENYQDLIALSEELADTNATPWCAGITAGWRGSWPASDWLEDMVLRLSGPDVYDQWVDHAIPFDDQRVRSALLTAQGILKNPKYVNGGYGGVDTDSTTPVNDAGLPILRNTCFLHHRDSGYQTSWPNGTVIDAGGDVWAFPLPAVTPGATAPLVVGGAYAAAFTSRPEVQALQYYLTSRTWAKAFTAAGVGVTPHQAVDPSSVTSPISRLTVDLIHAPDQLIRFDASDQVPPEVGHRAEPDALFDWISDRQGPAEALASVERSWPPR